MAVNRKDLICGLVFVVIGLLFALGTKELEMGTATRMGPGYFPLFLAGILILIGLIIAGKSFRKPDEGSLGEVPWKGMILILGSTIFFGYAIRGVGLVPAVAVVTLASAFASSKMSVPLAFLLSIILSVFCAAVFVYGLGLPIQLIGPWVRFW